MGPVSGATSDGASLNAGVGLVTVAVSVGSATSYPTRDAFSSSCFSVATTTEPGSDARNSEGFSATSSVTSTSLAGWLSADGDTLNCSTLLSLTSTSLSTSSSAFSTLSTTAFLRTRTSSLPLLSTASSCTNNALKACS